MFTLPLAKQLLITLTLVLLLTIAEHGSAQENTVDAGENTLEQVDQEVEQVEVSEQVRKARELEELGLAIAEKAKTLKSLKSKIRKSLSNPELELEIAVIEHQLETLNKSFEQVAIGSINLDVLGTDNQSKTWQEELTLVIKPLLENLRSLTEQPRRKENLRQIITTQKETADKALQALESIDTLLAQEPSKTQTRLLKDVKNSWLRTKEDAERQEQLALYQLTSLNGIDGNWFTNLQESLLRFWSAKDL
jgi:hypothetical protein